MSLIISGLCLFAGLCLAAFCFNIALRLPEYSRMRDAAERRYWRDTEGTFRQGMKYKP